MANKPDRKGAPQDGKPKKKKSNTGIYAIIWIVTLIAAFICGWQFGPTAAETGGSLVGGAGEAAIKADVLSKLDKSTLNEPQKKAITDAYEKDDVDKTAMGEAKFKIANKDGKISKDEWMAIAEAFGFE